MRDFVDITKALADENRVRALLALRDGELCMCQIIEFLDLAPSTVSKHMAILRSARLVDSRKIGRWVYYRLSADTTQLKIQDTLDWVFHSLAGSQAALGAARRLQEVLKRHPEELCRAQSKKQNKNLSCACCSNSARIGPTLLGI